LVALGLAAVDGLVVAHGQRDADGDTGRVGPDGIDALAVGVAEDLVDVAAGRNVLLAGRETADEVADRGDHARLVDRAGPAHQTVEPGGGLGGVGGEAVGGAVLLPAALVGQPAGG